MAVRASNEEVNTNVTWKLKRNGTQMGYHSSKYFAVFLSKCIDLIREMCCL